VIVQAAAWSNLIDALVRVEDVAPSDSGLLSFGVDASNGGILVEKGRICWAAARGMQQRLRDLLQAFAADRTVDFDRIYERCRAEGRLLGQTLVDEGWITPRELESALRRHSAESLIALCNDDDQLTRWISRGDHGYSPRFTFRPLDVLLDVVAVHVPSLQDTARIELARFDAPERHGGAFCVEAHDIAVPVAAFGDLTVNELWTLGRWATSLPRALRELGTTPSFTVAATATGDTIAVWWRGPLLYAVACDDRRGVAAIIASHLGGEPT
jgi:hypothetical protein